MTENQFQLPDDRQKDQEQSKSQMEKGDQVQHSKPNVEKGVEFLIEHVHRQGTKGISVHFHKSFSVATKEMVSSIFLNL